MLDRRDGKPIYEMQERPVPKGDVPGEWYSPTQPVPVKPPALTRQGMTRDEIAKVTPEQQQYCEALWDSNGGTHNDGAFTPMGAKQTVVFPASNGGANWGGGERRSRARLLLHQHPQRRRDRAHGQAVGTPAGGGGGKSRAERQRDRVYSHRAARAKHGFSNPIDRLAVSGSALG